MPKPGPKRKAPPGLKWCSGCQSAKEPSEFHSGSQACKVCRSATGRYGYRAYAETMRPYMREYMRRRRDAAKKAVPS